MCHIKEKDFEAIKDSVELIASGYEWQCPKQQCFYTLNREIEVTEFVKCRRCNTVYRVEDHCHAID